MKSAWITFQDNFHNGGGNHLDLQMFQQITLMSPYWWPTKNEDIQYHMEIIGMARGAKMRLARIWTNMEYPSVKPPHQLRACTEKLTEHGKWCMQNNQLPANCPVELNDSCNGWSLFWCFWQSQFAWCEGSVAMRIDVGLITLKKSAATMRNQNSSFKLFVLLSRKNWEARR